MEEEKRIIQASNLIKECDILLVITGAGWSADSNLPVYKDVASINIISEIFRK